MTILSTPFNEADHRAELRDMAVVAEIRCRENAAVARESARCSRDTAGWFHERGDRATGSRHSRIAQQAEARARAYDNEAKRIRAGLRREA